MSELPSYGEMAAEKLKERSKASGGELKNLVSYSTNNPEICSGPFGTFYSCFKIFHQIHKVSNLLICCKKPEGGIVNQKITVAVFQINFLV